MVIPKSNKDFTALSYDDARQRIKMIDREIRDHQIQLEDAIKKERRVNYMIKACNKMRQIFVDDLEAAGEPIYKEETDETSGHISDLYPVQSGDAE